MISLGSVSARRSPLALAGVSIAWGTGTHAVVGGTADGGALLLAIIAGRARPRTGSVRVLDEEPTRATVRPQVAYVPLRPELPQGMRVSEVLAIATAIRGEALQNPGERLATLGVETLASRRVETLSSDEVRAVALAEAITSARVRVLLVEEPFVGMDPRAATLLPQALRAGAHAGRAVVIATASLRDAGDMADDHVFLQRGTIVGRAASTDALARFSASGVRLRVVTNDALAFSAALAREEGVEAIARRGFSVTARGRDAMELARASARAVAASGVEVTEMRVQPPSLDEAHAGLASAGEDPRL